MENNHQQSNSLNLDSLSKIEYSKKVMGIWETHMESFCSGRNSAFKLSADLISNLVKSVDSETINIVDVACGYGGWSDFLQRELNNQNVKFEFTGMDESHDRLEVYQNVLGESANTIQGNILNTLPTLDKDKYSVFILGWAAHEIEQSQLENIYKSINQTLKTGGIFMIADFVSGLNPEVENISQQIIKKQRENLMADPESRKQELWLKEINSHNHHHHKHNHSEHNNQRHKHHYSVNEHFNFLKNAGFSLSEEVWRYMNSSMILAVK